MGAGGRAARLRWILLLVHVLLGTWAVHAWGEGPFRGAGGAEGLRLLEAALSASGAEGPGASGVGPLYPRALGLLLRAGGQVATGVGLLGVLASLAVLLGISHLCRRLALLRAELPSMALYVLSGSPLAFVPQPLPVLAGTALLLWGAIVLLPRPGAAPEPERAPAAARRLSFAAAVVGGVLCAGAVLTLPALLPAALLALLAGWRCAAAASATGARDTAGAARVAGGAQVARRGSWAAPCLALVLVLGALPLLHGSGLEDAGLRLRLGNGGERSGTTDLRPGPVLDRLRLAPVVAAWSAGAPRVEEGAFHRARLAEELAADPGGATATLLRKLFLFWHRTEIVSDADFRYALAGLLPLPLLLWSYGIIAPLALASLRRRRTLALWAPVLGVLAVNVLGLTSAADRLPALPFLCIAAGAWLADRPPLREWMVAGALAALLAVNVTGRPLQWSGDGALHRGDLLLGAGLVDPAAAALTEAVEAGRDPRAALLLGAAYDRAVVLHGDLSLRDRAEHWYREALQREPLYPEAADALLRVLIVQQRGAEALDFGEAYVARDPCASAARLSLASLTVLVGDKARTRELLVDGNRLLALQALARRDTAGAARAATELLRYREPDSRLEALVKSAAR